MWQNLIKYRQIFFWKISVFLCCLFFFTILAIFIFSTLFLLYINVAVQFLMLYNQYCVSTIQCEQNVIRNFKMNLLKFSFSSDWPNLLSSSVPQMYLYRNTRLCFGTPSLVQPQKFNQLQWNKLFLSYLMYPIF